MSKPEIYAVVMAGGSGTRFWPASRRDLPKQYLSIASDEPLLVETWKRLDGLVPEARRLIVTAASQAEQVRALLPNLPRENLIAEPCARNTAPCIALASLEIERRAADSVQIVLPSDHVIRPVEKFRATLAAAADEASESGALITLGIQPTHPATGFGYIETGEELARRSGIAVRRVARFVEKPTRERAIEMLAHGGFLWNSGLFVWRTAAIGRALDEFLPRMRSVLAKLASGGSIDELYPTLDSISIDVGVLEKSKNVRVLPIDYLWSDVGSWDALESIHPRDASGNVAVGGAELATIDAKGCIVYGASRELVALIGVSNLVVVHARGATLVCTKERAQEVKDLVARLERERKDLC